MQKAPPLIAFALLAAAGPAAAQAPTPAAVEERPAPAERRPASAAPRLNLKLDNPAQYTTEAPKEKDAGGNLPALGGNPVPYERPPAPRMNSASPFPKDSER